MTASVEKNLLLGIVSLQQSFVTREQLVAAASAWARDKSRPLGEVLVDQGAIASDTLVLLNTLVARHLTDHGNDAKRSIASFPAAQSVRDEFARLGDKELERAVGLLSEKPAARELGTQGIEGTVDCPPETAATRDPGTQNVEATLELAPGTPAAREMGTQGIEGTVDFAPERPAQRELDTQEVEGTVEFSPDQPAERNLGTQGIEGTVGFLPEKPVEREQGTVDYQGDETGQIAKTTPAEPSGRSASKREPELPGGRFQILRGHARGGLAQVSIALDKELRREVAFKELLDRHAADPQYRSRLLLEGEITGSLEHPGIVPVYGMGSHPDGRPFYAMRFIRGESLRETIKAFHQADTVPRDPSERTLEFRRLLTLFVTICNTIDYAHSRGVLHRDLKPDNIMLGKYGEALVVDWGLAKAMGQRGTDVHPEADPDLQLLPAMDSGTQMGSLIGTPAYMSPEQASGRVDELGPASDIYSLGATLYCLLTDRPAFEAETLGALLDLLRRGDFPAPRAVNPRVPVALEAICLKAMATLPGDRYPTARALGADIEHWLADEPVAAHRETLLERFFRWARRHRSWTRAVAVALVLVAIVSLVASVLVNRARQQAIDLAVRNRLLAEQEQHARREATDRLVEAQSAVDTWLTGMSESLAYYPGVQEARKQLLREAAADYERFVRQRSDDPALETERGRAYLRLGDVHRALREVKQGRQGLPLRDLALRETQPDARRGARRPPGTRQWPHQAGASSGRNRPPGRGSRGLPERHRAACNGPAETRPRTGACSSSRARAC